MYLAFCPLASSENLTGQEAIAVAKAIYAGVYRRSARKKDLQEVVDPLQGRDTVGRLTIPEITEQQ